MKVKFFATIREHTRSREIDVTEQGCGSVGIYCSIFAISMAGVMLPPFGGRKLGSQIIVLVNGRNVVHLRNWTRP